MTTSTIFRLDLVHRFKLATRAEGEAARADILRALEEHPEVELEFGQRPVTPSFADECVGILAARLGRVQFARRIHLLGVAPSVRPLFEHVVSQRTAKGESYA